MPDQTTDPRPVYCPHRGGIKQVCETPNACAGGADCRRGVDPAVSQTTTHTVEKDANVIQIGVVPRSNAVVRLSEGAPDPRPSVSNFNETRPPVWYDIAVCHHWDGTIQTWVKGVDMDDVDNHPKIAIALRQVADSFDPPKGNPDAEAANGQ